MLSDLAQALVGAELVVRREGSFGPSAAQVYHVQLPTTRTALVLLATWEGGLTLGEDGVVFWEEVATWLGKHVADEFQKPGYRASAVRAIRRLLTVGVPRVPRATESTGDEDPDAASRTIEEAPWESHLADFLECYHVDPLPMLWPLFLTGLRQIDRIQAASQHRFIDAYTATKSEEGFARAREIFEAAYPHRPRPRIQEPEWMTDEWYAEQAAKAALIRQTLGRA